MFSMVTVASSTRMPTARARPPSVITFRVWWKADRAAMAASTDSGIEVATIRVERHEPRNSRIIRLVSAAAITPSRITPSTAAFTKVDWSLMARTFSVGGRLAFNSGSSALMPDTTSTVEAEPVLSTVISTERWPSTCTTFCCGGAPSRTWATSPMRITAPLTVLIGKASSWWTSPGTLLRRRLYWKAPILTKPAGMIWVWAVIAAPTSWADTPLDCMDRGSRSIWIWRTLPP